MTSLVSLLQEETKGKREKEDLEAGAGLFAAEKEKPKKKKARKEQDTDHPAIVNVTLPDGAGPLCLQWPGGKPADVAVLLEATNLQRCFEYLASDCEQCEDNSKRTYNKTGKFAKGKGD